MASNKRLNATITIGGAITGSLRSAFGTTSKSLTEIGRGIQSLTSRQKELNRVIADQEKLGSKGSALKVGYARQELDLIDKQVAALRRKQSVMNSISSAQSANLARRSQIRGQLVDAVALGAGASAPIVMAAKFETAMLGVAKQLDGARDSSGQLTAKYFEMSRAIQQLGRELPIATNDIAEMVAAGLRMGVASDQVLEFVRRSAEMSTAFDLPTGELAENMGKIAGLYKIPIPAIGSLADAVNYLDDNAISKGGDIIDYLTRVGGVAGAVKIGATEVAALGSTLLTLGERTETAGTATNAMLQKLAAADKGTKKFRAAMAELGISTASVQSGMQKDAMGTMLKVLDAVNKMPADKRLGILTDLVGLEHSDTLAKLATNTGELRKQLALANSEAAKGSMSREFQARMQTTNAQWEISKNRVMELAVNIGSVLLPAINSLMGAVGPVVSSFAELAREYPTLTKAIVGTVSALAIGRTAFLAGAYAITFVKGAVLALRVALLTNPITAILTGIATAAYLIYENWEPIKGWFKGLWDDITATFRNAIGWIMSKIEWVGEKWRAVKNFVGFGDDTAPAAPAPLPPAPTMATGRGGSTGNWTDNSQTTFQIVQQPGESAEQLARRVAAIQEQQRQVRQRSQAYDGATP